MKSGKQKKFRPLGTFLAAALVVGCSTPGGGVVKPWFPPGTSLKNPGAGLEIEFPWPGEKRNVPPPQNMPWNQYFNDNNVDENTDLSTLPMPDPPAGYASWDAWYASS